jgi:ribonucleotide monophosphatase NagD (HAD superfamily)
LAQHYEAIGGVVRWHGKPYPSVYDSCLPLLGIRDRSRLLAVGDSLRTDIAGAVASGIDSLFVTGGIHAAEFGEGDLLDLARIEAALAEPNLRPIGVVRRFAW